MGRCLVPPLKDLHLGLLIGAVTLVGSPSMFCCVSSLEMFVIIEELSFLKGGGGIQPCAQPYQNEELLSKEKLFPFFSVWQI